MQSIDRVTIIKILKTEMPYLRQHFGVEQVALFGSFTRKDGKDSSDIDLVVDLSRPLGFAFMELADYLEGKLDRKVDLITQRTLEFGQKDPRRSQIAREIQNSLIYV